MGGFVLLASCGSPPPEPQTAQSLVLSGRASLPHNAPLSAKDATVAVTLTLSGGCTLSANALPVRFDENNAYTISVSTWSLHASKPECGASPLSKGKLQSVTLTAEVAPDSAICTSLCEASPAGECEDACSAAASRVSAMRVFDAAAIQKAPVNASKVLLLKGDLVFESLIAPSEGTPDFRIDEDALRSSVSIERRTFDETSCALVEQCIGGTGERRLLKFDTTIVNEGTGDFYLGDPTDNPNFEFSSCHGHYHLQEIATYELVRPETEDIVVVGHKQGFCIEDMEPYDTLSPERYSCANQGLSRGWGDVYGSDLECQWLDITDVPPGKYKLKLVVNPTGRYRELDKTNNVAMVDVEIP